MIDSDFVFLILSEPDPIEKRIAMTIDVLWWK